MESNYIRTVQEKEEFLSQLDILLANLFKTDAFNFEDTLKKTVSLNNVWIIKRGVKDHNIDTNDRTAIENLLGNIKTQVEKLKVLKIYLAFDPTTEIIDDIFNWTLKNIGEEVVLDIEKDESILGGAIIVFEGRYRDFTLKRGLEEIFQNKESGLKTILTF